MSLTLIGFLASLGAGLATGLGALPVLFGRGVSPVHSDVMLGFAAGVMLSASFFSLILPGIAAGEGLYGSTAIAAFVVAAGIAAGAAMVAALDAALPHRHFVSGPEGADPGTLPKIWLFVFAITIHNFPEGLAVGVGFGGGDISRGMSLAIGIGLQNAPEGLAVAVALLGQGYRRAYAFGVALLTGLVEPLGGLLGVGAVQVSQHMLPPGLTFAAGAMLYIISHEIIPETHRRGHQTAATAGLMAGLILMLLLDVTMG